jgi:hypothetical protein
MADEKPDQQPAEQRTYKITYADNKTLEAEAESVAWTENGEFILLMDGDVTKHVVVASNVIAVTQQ